MNKIGRICPVFEWSEFSARLDHFIQKKYFLLCIKQSSLEFLNNQSKTGTFDFRTQMDHSKTGLVRFSDGDCTWKFIIKTNVFEAATHLGFFGKMAQLTLPTSM
jgi:hypothetical protein